MAITRYAHTDIVEVVADVIAEKYDAAVESPAMVVAVRIKRTSVFT
jgi:hypothetical protein